MFLAYPKIKRLGEEENDGIILNSLTSGRDVVVDDTGFNLIHEKHLRAFAHNTGAEFKIHFVDTPLKECIARDAKREKPVGEKVIRQMYDQYLAQLTESEVVGKVVMDWTLPKALWVDIDGTLAHMNGKRGPFDWSKVIGDDCDINIRQLVQSWPFDIIIVSGRDSECRKDTEMWLWKYGIPYKELHMRPEGNCEKDSIIKERILRDLVTRYNIIAALDDRDQVVKHLRSLGVKVLQVAEGAF